MNAQNVKKINYAMSIASAWYNTPADILQAIAWQESGWGHQGDDLDILSFDGGHGKGIMQIDDRSHGFATDSAVFDVLLNVSYAARLLRMLFNDTQDWNLAIQQYNGSGPAAVAYAKSVQGLRQSKPWEGLISK